MRAILRGFDGLDEIYWATLPASEAHRCAAGMSREEGTLYRVDEDGTLSNYVAGKRVGATAAGQA